MQAALRDETHQEVADGCGVRSRSTVTRWGHAEEAHAPNIEHLYRGLQHPKSAAFCRRLLDALEDLRRRRGNGLDDGRQQAVITREVTDVLRELADAMQDGRVDGPEIPRMLREIDEARDVLNAYAAELRQRLREAV